ncbi:MAG: hypothetical protein LAQ69_51275, partial [Acidobacteriia bacterium]|nr:hypothetical protein [Terriglobia bacterium]
TEGTGDRGATPTIQKETVDLIYGLDRAGWEAYAKTMKPPAGWKMLLQPHDTGTNAAAFEVKTSIGISIQPVYFDASNRPVSIIWQSLYPRGTLPNVPDDYLRNYKSELHKDLGERYSVSAETFKAERFSGFMVTIYERKATTNG